MATAVAVADLLRVGNASVVALLAAAWTQLMLALSCDANVRILVMLTDSIVSAGWTVGH